MRWRELPQTLLSAVFDDMLRVVHVCLERAAADDGGVARVRFTASTAAPAFVPEAREEYIENQKDHCRRKSGLIDMMVVKLVAPSTYTGLR